VQCFAVKNTSPVNSGAKLPPQGTEDFFHLGIPEDSPYLGLSQVRIAPCYPLFPPYLVFDSGIVLVLDVRNGLGLVFDLFGASVFGSPPVAPKRVPK